MDSLNDDCLMLIFQILPFKDQISVLRANKGFLYVMRRIWKTKYKNKLELYINKNMPLQMDELKEFLSNVHENIENVLIKCDTFELIHELRHIQFTNTNKLVVDLNDEMRVMRDETVATLFQMFPNIKIFCPMGKFTGAGFTLWKGVEDLKLTFCYGFNFDYLEQLLKELPLRTLSIARFINIRPQLPDTTLQNSNLSKLVVNSYELAYFTPQIKNLRHLKHLHITDLKNALNLDALVNELVNLRETHCIEALGLLDLQALFPRIIDLRLHSHIRCLQLGCDPMAFSDMLIYIPLLPTLRVIHFKGCYVRSNKDFQKLFAVSNQLDEISLEDCTITYNSSPCLNVNEIVEQRTKVLIFNYYENKFCDYFKAELNTTGCSKLFKLESIPKVAQRQPDLVYEFSVRE